MVHWALYWLKWLGNGGSSESTGLVNIVLQLIPFFFHSAKKKFAYY
jgi:hypothetical protein